MDILRFITAGNVDDGKSTLIGRLLYDTANIKDDILGSVRSQNAKEVFNLAYITDGLRAERDQNITIDVAYKYFTTKNRKYIITDAPGHFQYTKNLVTGASNADVIVILIDACNGITEQTKRHALVASFLGIRNVIVVVNKMDTLNYNEAIFVQIKSEFAQIAAKLYMASVTYTPISALLGDNVTIPSGKMKWYRGTTLMQYLEACQPEKEDPGYLRYSVQHSMITDNTGLEGYAGKVLSGRIRKGDMVTIYPSAAQTKITCILNGHSEVNEAVYGHNVMIWLEDKAQRGAIVVKDQDPSLPHQQNRSIAICCNKRMKISICWLDATDALDTEKEYCLRMHTAETICKVTQVIDKTDINSLERYAHNGPVQVNEFATILVETEDAIAYDLYAILPATGRGVLIDRVTNYTVAAFIVLE